MNSPKLGVCTIVAKNYVGYARTMFRSLQAHHPAVKCYTVVVDEWQGLINPAEEPFELVPMAALGIADLESMAFKYDVTEFSTAVKPFLMAHLLASAGLEKLLYIDPDILVTRPLDKLFTALDTSDAVVTPHLDTDYPDDGKKPSDQNIMRHGVYNLGFIGVRKGKMADAFLSWWQHKLSNKCVQDPARGYYVDQRFVDLAVALFPGFHVERDTGFNTAYWNLHSRKISGEPGNWLCNGKPLYFFHFSGFSYDRPELVSRHTNRFTLQDRPDLVPIFSDYRQRLTDNGYAKASQWKYGYATFADGEPIAYGLRVLYRAALEKGMKIQDPFRSRSGVEAALELVRKSESDWRWRAFKEWVRSWIPPLGWTLIKKFKS